MGQKKKLYFVVQCYYTNNNYNSNIHDNYTYVEQINQTIHSRRTNNWNYLNKCTSNHPGIHCNTIPMTNKPNRWIPQPSTSTKSSRTPMILNLWIFRLHNVEFDSHTAPQEDQHTRTFRLLGTDNRTVLTNKFTNQIIATASDVLHSWTIPRLGVRTEATWGWLNHTRFSINWPHIPHGGHSELCGANHRFMLIIIERVSAHQFINWVSKVRESLDNLKQVMVSWYPSKWLSWNSIS
jgi:heme/copper-type cytochrome/quinol oxidase subunit 2